MNKIVMVLLILTGTINGMKIVYPELIKYEKKSGRSEYKIAVLDDENNNVVAGNSFQLAEEIKQMVGFSKEQILYYTNQNEIIIYDVRNGALKTLHYKIDAINQGVYLSLNENNMLIGTVQGMTLIDYPVYTCLRNIVKGSPWVCKSDTTVYLYFQTDSANILTLINLTTNKMSLLNLKSDLKPIFFKGTYYKRVEISPDHQKLGVIVYSNEIKKGNYSGNKFK